MSVKDHAIVTISCANNETSLCDNEGHVCPPGNLEDFNTNVAPNGKISWETGEGVSSITAITIDSGEDIFKDPPEEKHGEWEAKIDNKQSGGAKYSISYCLEGSTTPATIDPQIEIH